MRAWKGYAYGFEIETKIFLSLHPITTKRLLGED